MIAFLLNEAAATIVAADDGAPVSLLALGPTGGGAVHFGLWSRRANDGDRTYDPGR